MKTEIIEKRGFEFKHKFHSWQSRLNPLTESQFEVKLIDNNIESPAKLIFIVKNARNYQNTSDGTNIFESIQKLNKQHNLNIKY